MNANALEICLGGKNSKLHAYKPSVNSKLLVLLPQRKASLAITPQKESIKTLT